jgi:hypothetical protein
MILDNIGQKSITLCEGICAFMIGTYNWYRLFSVRFVSKPKEIFYNWYSVLCEVWAEVVETVERQE